MGETSGRRGGCLAALLVVLAGGAAVAQGLPGDAVRGEALAEDWCAKCHKTQPGVRDPLTIEMPRLVGEAPTVVEVPAFQAVADDPAATEAALRAFLRTPHRNMPDFRLAPDETDDLVAYILRLKGTMHPGT